MFDILGIDLMPCVDLNVNVDSLPKPNEGSKMNKMTWQGGGKVSTGMVAAARLGAKCALAGTVGDDIFGRFCVKDFERHGIDISNLHIHKGKTSVSVVMSDLETRGRSIMNMPTTVPRIRFEEIDPSIIQSAKYLFFARVNETIVKAVDAARNAGVKVFIDADSYSDDIQSLIPKIDYFIGSEFYYRHLFENDNFKRNCRELAEMGPQVVVFTLGNKGCVGLGPDGFFSVPTYPVTVVDTVGAGDVFHGAFLAALVAGWRPRDAADFANAVSSIKCTRIGGRAGIPDMKTVLRFMKDGFIDYTEIDKRVELYERGLDNV